MPRLCAVCAGEIEDNEPYQVCSGCHRNYHVGHQCPQHPHAAMIQHAPRQSRGAGRFGSHVHISAPGQTQPIFPRASSISRPPPPPIRMTSPRSSLWVRRFVRLTVLAGILLICSAVVYGMVTDGSISSSGESASGNHSTDRTTAEGRAVATRDARMNVRTLKSGPFSGRLTMGSEWSRFAGVNLRDPIVEVRLMTPATNGTPWDYGIMVRSDGPGAGYRVVITSDKEWICDLLDGDPNQPVNRQRGQLTRVDTEPGEHNDLQLLAIGDEGLLFVNDHYVTTLDFSGNQTAGEVGIGVNLLPQHNSPATTGSYNNFTVSAKSAGSR